MTTIRPMGHVGHAGTCISRKPEVRGTSPVELSPPWAREHVDAGVSPNPEECLPWVDRQNDMVMWK